MEEGVSGEGSTWRRAYSITNESHVLSSTKRSPAINQRDFQVTNLPSWRVISEVNVARWRRWVHTFLFLFVSISFAFYFLFDMLDESTFLLLFICFCTYLLFFILFFSVYLEMTNKERNVNKIAFQWWAWYNMNVITTLNSDSWLGKLGDLIWMTWMVGLLLACRENDISTKEWSSIMLG